MSITVIGHFSQVCKCSVSVCGVCMAAIVYLLIELTFTFIPAASFEKTCVNRFHKQFEAIRIEAMEIENLLTNIEECS